MTGIDHILFEFTVPDEPFAQNLYANWEHFCQYCFEQVAEECLAPYGKEQTLYELERLNLDLGSISENDFYNEFPLRLKEALTNALPALYSQPLQTCPQKTTDSCSRNLLFYLEYGHPLPEWANPDFHLQEETDRIANLSGTSYNVFIREAAVLCLKQNHALRRLVEQTDQERLLLDIYTAAITEPSAGHMEKSRILTLLLEIRPDIPVRFVHVTNDITRLQDMSDLLNTLSVRLLIQNETKEHAEVDLPPYWHHLYEWLIKYYPYNGIAMFGNKAEFTRYLHHRLLTFIHKRNGTHYLSKTELTIGFLLEVFGPTHYKDILNAIYQLQPHNPDGSPVYDNYFNNELYQIFLQLSLLRLMETTQSNLDTNESLSPKDINILTESEGSTAILTNIKEFHIILQDQTRSDEYKRLLWAMLVREHPETLVHWLQSELPKNNALLPLLAELAEDATVERLLATFSLALWETMNTIREYLDKYKKEIPWMKAVSDAQWAFAIRRCILQLLTSSNPDHSDSREDVLRLIYQEVTGNPMNDNTDIKILINKLHKSEYAIDLSVENGNIRVEKKTNKLQSLYQIVYNPSLSKAIQRRATVLYWDNHQEDYAEAVHLLHEQHMLDKVLELTDRYVWEIILYQILRQTVGMTKASTLIPLCQWLVANEDFLSSCLADTKHSLRTGLLLKILNLGQGKNGMSLQEVIPFLFTSMFRRNSLPLILKQIGQDTVSGAIKVSDAKQMMDLLDAAFNSDIPTLSSLYKKWLHERENDLNTLQKLFESRWNTAECFAGWINAPSVPIATKRRLLRKAIHEKPQEWLKLLRALPKGNQALASLESMMTTQELLESMAKINFHQANILSKIMEQLQHPVIKLPLSLSHGNILLKNLLKKALLAYLQDSDTLDRTWNEKEIVSKFLHYLQLAATGKKNDETDAGQWQQLAEIITATESDLAIIQPKKNLLQALANPSISRTVLQKSLACMMNKYPRELLAWLELDADINDMARIAETTDRIQITYWTECLTLTPGFTHADSFRQLIDWLLQQMPTEKVATALFLYVKEQSWRTFTPEQTETYFFSQLYGQTNVLPPMETLMKKTLSENMRKQLFHQYLRQYPEKLLAFLRENLSRDILPSDEWLQSTDASDLLYLAASISVAKAELLQQITDILSLPEKEKREALATYLLHGNTEEWPYSHPLETVYDFLKIVPSIQKADTEKKKETMRQMKIRLNLIETEVLLPEDRPELISIDNAGLCLLAPWFIRLFTMLGYLDEDKKRFRNTASKIRAIFLLQYLACGEEKAWREMELTFNRLLTALPGHVPLPKCMTLTDEERQTADSMMAGVKINWPQMHGTSVKGFRDSFLFRDGKLEQDEERWILTVEEKAYDILLETIPWSFRQIRLPWLKKYIQTKWREKQIF